MMIWFAFLIFCIRASIFASEDFHLNGDVANLQHTSLNHGCNACPKASLSEVVNIMIVIDTDCLLTYYDKPSKNPKQPTNISSNFAFSIASAKYVVSGQATGNLNIRPRIGDQIRWSGISEVNNFFYKIILYRVTYNDKKILSPPKNTLFSGKCIYPVSTDITETTYADCTSIVLAANVTGCGDMEYNVWFALYGRNRISGKHELYGYFDLGPQLLTVVQD